MIKWAMAVLSALTFVGCASNDSQGGSGSMSGSLRSNPEDRRMENRISDNHRNPSTTWSNMK